MNFCWVCAPSECCVPTKGCPVSRLSSLLPYSGELTKTAPQHPASLTPLLLFLGPTTLGGWQNR